MTRRSHRGRKGDGWPKRPPSLPSLPPLTFATNSAVPHTDTHHVCPQGARCGHVVCAIVWYCVEAG